MTDGTGSESYLYDPGLGRITQVSKVISGTSYPTQYAYNLAGELTQLTYPSGRVVAPSYDAAGRLNQIASAGTNYLSQAAYNAAGETLGFTYGNGVQASFGYNTRLQLATLRYYTGSGDLLNLSYGYGLGSADNGQIQTITDNLDASKSLSYTYDALSRLQYATAGPTGSPTWKLGFVYDRYGNRTNENLLAGTGPSGMWTPDPTTNRLPAPYQYDAAGNMTNDSFNTYPFDAVNRIKQVTSNGATYSYDGNGLRVQRTSSGTTTTYVFSGTKVIAEYAGGALSKEYIYAGSQLLATVDASTGSTSYQHPDHLSARVETSATGSPTRTFGHFPYGEIWYETGTAGKWKFTSYERDSESNLDYAMARHYSNVVARFMSPDPLAGTPADPQSLNRYAYVRNDPIRNTDPLGLFCGPGSIALPEGGCGPAEEEPEVEPTGIDIVSLRIFIARPWDDLFVCHGQRWCDGPVDKGALIRRLLSPKCADLFGGLRTALRALAATTYSPSSAAPADIRSTFDADPNQVAYTKSLYRTPSAVPSPTVFKVDTYLAGSFFQLSIADQQVTLLHELFHGVGYTGDQTSPIDSSKTIDPLDSQQRNALDMLCPPGNVETQGSNVPATVQ